MLLSALIERFDVSRMRDFSHTIVLLCFVRRWSSQGPTTSPVSSTPYTNVFSTSTGPCLQAHVLLGPCLQAHVVLAPETENMYLWPRAMRTCLPWFKAHVLLVPRMYLWYLVLGAYPCGFWFWAQLFVAPGCWHIYFQAHLLVLLITFTCASKHILLHMSSQSYWSAFWI